MSHKLIKEIKQNTGQLKAYNKEVRSKYKVNNYFNFFGLPIWLLIKGEKQVTTQEFYYLNCIR
jgi:hypothetical protein